MRDDPDELAVRRRHAVAMLHDPARFAFAARRHHASATSGNAYDATQTDERVSTGDTLIVLAEQVVGVACTWPFAVTAIAGALHQVNAPAPSDALASVAAGLGVQTDDLRHAAVIASALGFPIAPDLIPLLTS